MTEDTPVADFAQADVELPEGAAKAEQMLEHVRTTLSERCAALARGSATRQGCQIRLSRCRPGPRESLLLK